MDHFEKGTRDDPRGAMVTIDLLIIDDGLDLVREGLVEVSTNECRA
jgi:hypothetical protein